MSFVHVNVKASGPKGSISYRPYAGNPTMTEPERVENFDEAESVVREEYVARFGEDPVTIDLEYEEVHDR